MRTASLPDAGQVVEISGGPDKEELEAAFFGKGTYSSSRPPYTVAFEAIWLDDDEDQTIIYGCMVCWIHELSTAQLEYEFKSRDEWDFVGVWWNKGLQTHQMKGTYSTTTRKGSFVLNDIKTQ